MDKDELIRRVETIQDPKKEKEELYSIMEELGIGYKKTNCPKCLRDYLNIVKEELGLIDSAAEESTFDTEEWVYLRDRNFVWTKQDGTKVKISKNTPPELIEEFVKTHKGFYKKIKKQ